MEKIILEGVEIQFNDFSKEMQEKLYSQNAEKYREEAAKSQYASMRTLIAVEEKDSSKLNEMLRREMQGDNDKVVKKAIRKNPNFKLDKETIGVLANSKYLGDRVIAAKEETDSSKLNEMLRKKIINKDDEGVIKAIRENPNFKIEKETIEVFANSKDWDNRVIAAEEETDSSKLNEMLRRELQGKYDSDVIKAIRENPNFKIEKETIGVLANSENWEDRLIAAEEETDSSKLNERLRKEVQNGNDEDVVNAIMENSNLKLEEETIKVLENSGNWKIRLIVAQSEKIPTESLETMYQKEKDTDILEALEDNMERRALGKKVQLSMLQKQKILKVLKKFKNSKYSVENCFEKILEIIG